MAQKVKTPTVLDDTALDAANGGADSLHLLAQVNHLKAENASTSTRTASTANNKGIIAILIGL